MKKTSRAATIAAATMLIGTMAGTTMAPANANVQPATTAAIAPMVTNTYLTKSYQFLYVPNPYVKNETILVGTLYQREAAKGKKYIRYDLYLKEAVSVRRPVKKGGNVVAVYETWKPMPGKVSGGAGINYGSSAGWIGALRSEYYVGGGAKRIRDGISDDPMPLVGPGVNHSMWARGYYTKNGVPSAETNRGWSAPTVQWTGKHDITSSGSW